MTRRKLRIYLGIIVGGLLALIATYVVARATGLTAVHTSITDLSRLILALVAALLVEALQRRGRFVGTLREEWRSIVDAKSALTEYCEKERSDFDAYVDAFMQLSRTIDSMRVIYRNVDETDELVGYYPYEPLQDMRRYIQTLDPREHEPTKEDFKKVQTDIVGSFLALREVFLDEIDIAPPSHPILQPNARRRKKLSPPKD